MAKNSMEAYQAEGKSNLLFFDPEKLLLVTDKNHRLYDPRVDLPVNEALVNSIMFRGVVEPAIVWKDPETGEVCVVDGRQRVKSCREANKRLKKQGEQPKLVKAIVERGDSKSVAVVMAMANEGRADVTPLGRAKMAQRFLEMGYSEEIVATVMHCSLSALKNYLALLECTAAVRDAVEKGTLPATHAYKLAKLEPGAQRATLGKILKAGASSNGKHERAKKMRAVTGDKHRTWTEIAAMRETLDQRDDQTGRNWLEALDWVLGTSDSYPKPEERDEG